MQWFKLYVEARNDAKLRSLTDAQFRVWFNLLCYASEQSDRGVIEVEDDRLLAIEVSKGDIALLDETCNELQALRIVTCVTRPLQGRYIEFLNFEKRQGANVTRNARSSAERVRKHRERKKLGNDETNVTRCNADVTPVTPVTRLEENREEENRREEKTPPTPLKGEVDEGEVSPAEEPSLRSQRKTKVSLEQIQALTDWAREVIGERGESEFYFQKIRGWACSYPLEWIETAILCTAAGADTIEPGNLARYTGRCLSNWHPHGPPKAEREVAARQRSVETKRGSQDDDFDSLLGDPEYIKFCEQLESEA